MKDFKPKKLSRKEMKTVLGGGQPAHKECPEGQVWCDSPTIKPRCLDQYNC